jgi:hypothetical protein
VQSSVGAVVVVVLLLVLVVELLVLVVELVVDVVPECVVVVVPLPPCPLLVLLQARAVKAERETPRQRR